MALAFHDQRLPRCAPPARSRPPATRRAQRRRPPSVRTCSRRVIVRRRMLAGAAVVVLGVAGLSGAWAALSAAGGLLVSTPTAPPAAVDRPVVVRTVRPGDTLWGIAGSLGGGGDIRARVDELARLNGGSLLRPGDRIRIPSEWIGAGR